MDPQIHQDHPGNCPICGMGLTPLSTTQSSHPAPPSEISSNPVRGVMPEQSMAAVIHLNALQTSAGNLRTCPVGELMIHPKVELFGEISAIADKQLDFTWYYGGRIQKALVDYNTTEIAEKTPLLEVYSDEAIADQRMYLEMLLHHRQLITLEQSNMESQYGALSQKIRVVGVSYEHMVNEGNLHAIKERLSRAGMTPWDFEALENMGKLRTTFQVEAPQPGTLLGTLPHVGSHFETDEVLFSLTPLKEVWFVADVFEQDLSLLKLGQEITISSKSYPGQLFHGKLVFIGKAIDPRKRTLKARFLVSNPQGLLLPQLSATGILEVAEGKAQLAVPVSSVIDTGRRQLVYVETSPGTYALRTVKVGSMGDIGGMSGMGEGSSMPWVQILEGLKPGEKVVTSGAFLIDAEAQLHGLPATSRDPEPTASKPLP
jgi:Cu(I)/Ag(I) efflux system membrane fusion protein